MIDTFYAHVALSPETRAPTASLKTKGQLIFPSRKTRGSSHHRYLFQQERAEGRNERNLSNSISIILLIENEQNVIRDGQNVDRDG